MSDIMYTDEQRAVADVLRHLVSDNGSPAHERRAARAELWQRVTAAGLIEAPPPDEDAASVLLHAAAWEATGWLALPLPYVETTVFAYELIARVSDPDQRAHLSARIAQGEALVPIGRSAANSLEMSGTKVRGRIAAQRHADSFTTLVILGPDHRIYLLRLDALALDPELQVGTSAGAAPIEVVDVNAEALQFGEAGPVVWEHAMRALALATSFRALGGMRRALSDAAEHAALRRQFGKRLVEFQALRHRMADMRAITDGAGALIHAAAALWVDPDAAADRRNEHLHAARIHAANAFLRVARSGVQVHGAMGYAWETRANALLRAALDDLNYPLPLNDEFDQLQRVTLDRIGVRA